MAFGPGASVLAAVTSSAAATLIPGRVRRQPAYRVCFNIGLVSLCASVSAWVYVAAGGTIGIVDPSRDLGAIATYTACFAILNVGLIAVVTHLAGEATARRSLGENMAWTIPGFLAGSSLAAVLGILLQHESMAMLVLAAPFAYLLELSYRARIEKAEAVEHHLRQTAELYQSVTRALALAIEAKDENTEEHLQRVQQLCLRIAERLGLPEPERVALRAAALLHDIGKIGVPEYILTKPGRLTADEMAKMRVHPTVGADILSAVPFPYPLAPIVRHHHERWDGTGYPDRLAGTRIPLGARILTLVDCYDALTTDRPYRKAVTRDEAVDYLRRESGRIFDPSLVEVLASHVEELDRDFRPAPVAPASQVGAPPLEDPSGREGLDPRAEAQGASVEIEALDEMTDAVTLGLGLDDTLTLLASKLARVVSYRTLVVYLFDEGRERIVARHATGLAARRLIGLTIPLGARMSGWAALHQRPHGDRSQQIPLDRDGARSDLEELAWDPEIAELQSAVVTPLSTESEQLGVLALYDTRARVFDAAERRFLAAAAAPFAQGVLRGLACSRSEGARWTDVASGVPNLRFLRSHALRSMLDGEPDSSGLLAFRIEGLRDLRDARGADCADLVVGEAARRLGKIREAREILVRMGSDRFAMLVPDGHARVLAARSLEVARAVQTDPVELPGGAVPVRLQVVHAGSPADGSTVDDLVRSVERRLEASLAGAATSAFPMGRWSCSGIDARG
jgi:putative nucleotidyltransferase with HDIG domain